MEHTNIYGIPRHMVVRVGLNSVVLHECMPFMNVKVLWVRCEHSNKKKIIQKLFVTKRGTDST